MDVRRDLGEVAALIEICFGDQLDGGGRAAVREKKALSQYGPLLGLFGGLLKHVPGWHLGFVWMEDGRLVGNVGLQPSPANRAEWLIANVAVHPDYRRLGIARRLMRAAIEMAANQGGRAALLQVDNDNEGARRLYDELDFDSIATYTHWERRVRQTPPLLGSAYPTARLAARQDARAVFDLLQVARPYGLAWTQPLDMRNLRPSFYRWLNNTVNGRREEQWLLGPAASPDGWMCLQFNLGRADRIALVARAASGAQRERVERALLVRGLRRFGRRPWPVRIEHPAGRSDALFEEYRFQPLRTLRWMRLAL